MFDKHNITGAIGGLVDGGLGNLTGAIGGLIDKHNRTGNLYIYMVCRSSI